MFKELGPDILHYDQGYCSKSSDSLDLSELKPARTTRLTCPLLLICANKCDRIDTICSAIDRIRLAKSFPVAPISLLQLVIITSYRRLFSYHAWLLSIIRPVICARFSQFPSISFDF